MDLQTFVAKWQQSRAEERSNKDGFLYDLGWRATSRAV
jgi:hypothetical protein